MRSNRNRWLLFTLLALVLNPVVSLADAQHDDALRVVFFNVGAADCTLVMCDDEAMLIDTGYKKTWNHVKGVITEQNVQTLKYLIATHPDADHIAALPNTLQDFKVESVILPPIEKGSLTYEKMIDAIGESGVPTLYPRAGDQYLLGSTTVTVYGPSRTTYRDENDWSIVLMIAYGGRTVLFTGDAGFDAENDMVSNNEKLPLKSDVLKVEHHGSDTSTSYDFAAAVNPVYAVVSCSSTDTKNYPSTDVAMILMSCGVKDIFTTEMHGDITLRVSRRTARCPYKTKREML